MSLAIVVAAGCGGGSDTSAQPPPAPPSNLSYAPVSATYYLGVNMTNMTAKIEAASALSWTTQPALPSGITIDPEIGLIGGKPAVLAPKTTYTITASNAQGNTSTTVTFDVEPPPPAPSNLSYPSPPANYYLNVPIAPLTPTVTGPVTTWIIQPGLPSGLSFDQHTGVISGTPTALAPTKTYVIDAVNVSGVVSAEVTFVVNNPAAFIYGGCEPEHVVTNYQYTVGVVAQPLTPLYTGSCGLAYNNGVKPWSVSPALPAGLIFDTGTGTISGTPTAVAPAATYLITGGSPGGALSVPLTIGVSANILLDLGHASPIDFIQFDTAHVLSQDSGGHWALWNYATTAQIANGNSLTAYNLPHQSSSPVTLPSQIAVAGPTMVINTNAGFEMRSSATGVVLGEVALPSQPSWWKLAPDGSYVCDGTASSLACWSPTGQQLFTESGNYANAVPLAAANALFVALGAAGQDVIETLATAAWSSTTGPVFQGAFYAWFVDGSAFLTTVAATNTVSVYSLAAVLKDTRSLPTLQNLTGQGNWFWTWTNQTVPLNIYAVGNSAAPTASFALFPVPTPIGTFMVQFQGNGSATAPTQNGIFNLSGFTVIDLSGAMPVETSYSVPPLARATAYAAIAPTQFMLGNLEGVVVDESTPGPPRNFGYGIVTNIAGSAARAVLTTASGNTFSYESATNVLGNTIDLSSSQQFVLSSDGSVLASLAAVTAGGNENVNIYSMPSGAVIDSLSYSTAGAYPVGISLSAGGSMLGEVLVQGTGANQSLSSRQTVVVTGGATTAYPAGSEPVQLSPDGTRVALSNAPVPNNLSRGTPVDPATSIYANGALATTLSGYPVGWLDNGRLLVNNYGAGPNFNTVFTLASIYGPTGSQLGTAPIPEIDSFQVVTSDLVYSPGLNQIVSLTSGIGSWASGDPDVSSNLNVITASEVVFESGNLLLAQPH